MLSVNCLRNIKSSKLFQSCERCLNTSNDTLITSHTSWLNTSDNLCWNCCGRSNTSSRESTDHDCTQFIGIACGTKEQLIVVNKNLCRSSRNYIADNLCSWIYLCFDGVSCFRNPCTTKELINFLLSPRKWFWFNSVNTFTSIESSFNFTRRLNTNDGSLILLREVGEDICGIILFDKRCSLQTNLITWFQGFENIFQEAIITTSSSVEEDINVILWCWSFREQNRCATEELIRFTRNLQNTIDKYQEQILDINQYRIWIGRIGFETDQLIIVCKWESSIDSILECLNTINIIQFTKLPRCEVILESIDNCQSEILIVVTCSWVSCNTSDSEYITLQESITTFWNIKLFYLKHCGTNTTDCNTTSSCTVCIPNTLSICNTDVNRESILIDILKNCIINRNIRVWEDSSTRPNRCGRRELKIFQSYDITTCESMTNNTDCCNTNGICIIKVNNWNVVVMSIDSKNTNGDGHTQTNYSGSTNRQSRNTFNGEVIV